MVDGGYAIKMGAREVESMFPNFCKLLNERKMQIMAQNENVTCINRGMKWVVGDF